MMPSDIYYKYYKIKKRRREMGEKE